MSELHLPQAFAVACPQCGGDYLHEDSPTCASCGFALESSGRIVLLEHAPVEDDYPAAGSATQEHVSSRHFWFAMRNRFIQQLLEGARADRRGARFVEYGISNGLVMKQLEQAGWKAVGNDMHLGGLRNAANLVEGPILCGPLEKVRFRDPVDAVGFFDVIEHLSDDYSALKHAVAQLKPGGHLIVTVPAIQGLWSDFDDLLGHKRRYSASDLRGLFGRLGLESVALRYAFFFSYPLVWLQRNLVHGAQDPGEQRKRYYRPPHPVVNAVLTGLCRLELALVGLGWRPPIGTSVMGLARKPAA